jgi:hypothetical protein
VSDAERGFCAAWERVVKSFLEGVQGWEAGLTECLLLGEEGDDDELGMMWEGYLAAVEEFGKVVRGFEDEFLTGAAKRQGESRPRW